MENILAIVSAIVGILIMLCFAYQGIYVIIGLVRKPKRYVAKNEHRYAVLISARNESAVIANLVASIKAQNYRQDLLDVYVVADNCTDDTAQKAKHAGAIVYERFDERKIGKGYALNYLFHCIDEKDGIEYYDGYFVFDADNILEKDYVKEMNAVFDNGYRIVTSYRNSKNYDSNWISAGSALWFLREAKFLNNVRMMNGTSCAVSGTGFLIHKDIIQKNKGWIHYLLTEDIEFSTDNILQGEKIGYCGTAIFYDEQPIRFVDSWNQRLRWSKGFYQVFFKYGKNLAAKAFGRFDFSCYDMFVTLMPAIGLTILTVFIGGASLVLSFVNFEKVIGSIMNILAISLFNSYMTFFVLGVITTITEWKRIYCKAYKKIVYLFTFPIFMLTYVPISFVALFTKAKWKPINHSIVRTVQEIQEQ